MDRRCLLDVLDAYDESGIDFLGRRTSAAVLRREVRCVAAGLRAIGVLPGDRVVSFMLNAPPAVVALFATLEARARPVLLDPREEEAELGRRLEESAPALILTLDPVALFDKLLRLLPACPGARVVMARYAALLPFPRNVLLPLLRGSGLATLPPDDRFLSFAGLARHDPESPSAPCAGPIALPRGCFSQADLLDRAASEPAPHRGERWLLGLPLSDPRGLAALLAGLSGRAEILLSPRLDPETLTRMARRRRATRLVR